MSLEPWINWQFHKTPNYIDPRATFTRATTGSTVNRIGAVSNVKSNTSRYKFSPVSQVCQGLLVEPQRTNLLLQSQELDNITWTVTSMTVTANTLSAPDLTTTADTLTVTGAGGTLAQTVTITAGNGIAVSMFAKAGASNFLYIKIAGTISVECWYNLSTGVTGTNTAGSGTCVFRQKNIEDYGNGWYRCTLIVTTSTETSYTASFAPAAADNTAPANGNNIYAWGSQLESSGATTWTTSYIPTTSSSVTRNADNLSIPVTSSQVPLDRGTMVFEWTEQIYPSWSSSSAGAVMGGIGDTFSNTLYISQPYSGIYATYISGATSNPLTFNTCTHNVGETHRYAVTWQPGRLAACVDGGTVSVTSSANITAFGSIARIAVGFAPFGTTASTNVSGVAHRSFMYMPDVVDDTVLQTITRA